MFFRQLPPSKFYFHGNFDFLAKMAENTQINTNITHTGLKSAKLTLRTTEMNFQTLKGARFFSNDFPFNHLRAILDNWDLRPSMFRPYMI